MTTPFKPLKPVVAGNILEESEMNISMEEGSLGGSESGMLASPPRKKGASGPQSSGLFGGTASRLFGESDIESDHDDGRGVPRESILKPLDLNQERTTRRTEALTPVRKTGGHTRMEMHRKRLAEHQLIGRDLSFDDVEDLNDEAKQDHNQNSPVDLMEQSPLISPNPYKSPNSRPAAHKSPRYRTMDGRTVQSKNPFSPMYTEDPSALLASSTAALADALNLPTSLSGSTGPSNSGLGPPFLRHRPQKRDTHVDLSSSFSSLGTPESPPTTGTSTSISTGTPPTTTVGTTATATTTTTSSSGGSPLHYKAFTRDGYPERQGRYSFTGSPIHEMDTVDHHHSSPNLSKQHKVPRRSRFDDAAVASTIGEGTSFVHFTTKKKKKKQQQQQQQKVPVHLFVDTQPHQDDDNNSEKSYYRRSDEISPTDVLSFPSMASPSSPSTPVPPTPSKPSRPHIRYTPVRKPTVPPTPMMERRTKGSLDTDDEEEDESSSHRHPSRTLQSRMPPSRFHSDFDIIDELGNGSFGKVFKVMSRLDGCMYAIKVANRPAKGVSDKDRMLKEVYALAALSDQADTATFHIVRYHQAWMEEHRLYIQTELCTSTLAAEMKDRPLSVERRYKFLREMCLALEFIHKNGMVHLDIKPENIFVKNDQFKLGDFGLVSKVSEHDVEEGDSRYMSMELLSGDHADLTKSDIFSLGITLYEICLAGSRPLPTNGQEWQALRAAKFAAPLSNTPNEMQSLILLMMNPYHASRPSASGLLQKPQLLSPEQKALLAERNKVAQANLALAALAFPRKPPPKGLLVRSNTWNGSYSH